MEVCMLIKKVKHLKVGSQTGQIAHDMSVIEFSTVCQKELKVWKKNHFSVSLTTNLSTSTTLRDIYTGCLQLIFALTQ